MSSAAKAPVYTYPSTIPVPFMTDRQSLRYNYMGMSVIMKENLPHPTVYIKKGKVKQSIANVKVELKACFMCPLLWCFDVS